MAITKEAVDASVETNLKNLFALQTILTEIDQIRTLRGELPLEVQDLEDEIEGLTTRIEKINTEMDELHHQIAERKGGMEVNTANIERYKSQMDVVRNNREYDNLSKQIEYAELDNQLNEKRINEAKELLEAKSEEVAKCREDVDDRRAALELKKNELDEIIAETKTDEDLKREQAKNIEGTIPERLLNAFKRIRKNSRNGLGIVYVLRDACGGCFNKIPPQRQLDIRMRKKIIVCEYCGRIMIDPELAGVETVAKKKEEKPKRRRTTRKKATE